MYYFPSVWLVFAQGNIEQVIKNKCLDFNSDIYV